MNYFFILKQTEKAYLFDNFYGQEFWVPKTLTTKHSVFNIFTVEDWFLKKINFPEIKKWKKEKNKGLPIEEKYIYSNGHLTIEKNIDFGQEFEKILTGTYISIFDGSLSQGKRKSTFKKIEEKISILGNELSKEEATIIEHLSFRSQNLFFFEIKGKYLSGFNLI